VYLYICGVVEMCIRIYVALWSIDVVDVSSYVIVELWICGCVKLFGCGVIY